MRAVSWATIALAACGLTVGRAPFGLVNALPVSGATLEPGLAMAVEGSVVRALARAGAASERGAPLSLVIREVDHLPLAAVAGGRAETWRARLRVEARIVDRPGCAVAVQVEEPWAWPADPAGVPAQRARAVHRVAELAGDRLIDALVAEPSCRPPR